MGKVDNIKKVVSFVAVVGTSITTMQKAFDKTKKITKDREVKELIDRGTKLLKELQVVHSKLKDKLKKDEQ